MADLGDRPEGREAVARKLWEQARSEYDYDWDSNADQFRRQADELIPVIAAAVRAPLEERIAELEAERDAANRAMVYQVTLAGEADARAERAEAANTELEGWERTARRSIENEGVLLKEIAGLKAKVREAVRRQGYADERCQRAETALGEMQLKINDEAPRG